MVLSFNHCNHFITVLVGNKVRIGRLFEGELAVLCYIHNMSVSRKRHIAGYVVMWYNSADAESCE